MLSVSVGGVAFAGDGWQACAPQTTCWLMLQWGGHITPRDATCHGDRCAVWGLTGGGWRRSGFDGPPIPTSHRPFCCNVGSRHSCNIVNFCEPILSENISKWWVSVAFIYTLTYPVLSRSPESPSSGPVRFTVSVANRNNRVPTWWRRRRSSPANTTASRRYSARCYTRISLVFDALPEPVIRIRRTWPPEGYVLAGSAPSFVNVPSPSQYGFHVIPHPFRTLSPWPCPKF